MTGKRGQAIFLFFVVLAVCNGQKCASGCSMNLTACSNIDYLLFVPLDSTVVAMQENAAAEALAKVAVVQSFNPTCYNAISSFICNIFHPSCNESNPEIPQPIPVCTDLCYDLHVACGTLLNIVPPPMSLLFDCSNTTIYTNNTGPNTCSRTDNTIPLCNPPTYTGQCQEFNASLAPNYGKMCGPFISKYIFVPDDNATTSYAQRDTTALDFVTNMKLFTPIIPMNCYQIFMSALCAQLFPSCLMVDVRGFETKQAVGQMPCLEDCFEAFDTCAQFFHEANIVLPKNCSDFPFPSTNPYAVGVLNETIYIPCRTTIFPEDQASVPWSIPTNPCPTETGRKKNPGPKDAPCGMACPDASYTRDEWHTIVILTQVGSAISLFCMFFLILSYMVNFEKRKFPNNLHLNEFVATFMFSLSFLIGGSNPEKDVWCVDEGTNATQRDNAACATQGFFFIVFGLALAAWCAVIAYIILFSLLRPQGFVTSLRSQLAYFILCGWALPLAFGIAALASDNIGYGPPLAWCFIHFNGFGYGSGISKDYPLFYIPIGFLFVVILILFCTTTGVIAFIRKRRAARMVFGFDAFIRTQIRVLIFIFIIFAIFFTIFEWRIAIQTRNDRYHLEKIGLEWTYCKIKKALSIENPGVCPGELNPARIDYRHTIFESFLLSGIGSLIFIAFGTDKQLYVHWVMLTKLIVAAEWDNLADLVFKGREPCTKYNPGSKDNSGSNKTSSNESTANKKSDETDPTIVLSLEASSSIGSGSEGIALDVFQE